MGIRSGILRFSFLREDWFLCRGRVESSDKSSLSGLKQIITGNFPKEKKNDLAIVVEEMHLYRSLHF